MKTFIKTFFNLFARPAMLINALILGIVIGYCEFTVPIKEIFLNFFWGESLNKLDIMDSIVYLIRILIGGLMDIWTILDILKYILILSIVAAPLYCIVFATYNSNVIRKKKLTAIQALKKYFIRVFLKTFVILTVAVVLLILLIVATIPAFIYTRAVLNGLSQYMVRTIFIDALTVFVLFFIVNFAKSYLSFWLTATVNDDPQPFKTGRQVANISFWQLAISFFVLDIVYIVIMYLMFKLPTSTVTYFVRGIVNGFCITFFLLYILIAYANSVKKILKSQS